jgi:hypothetical protein
MGPVRDSSIWVNPGLARKNEGRDPYLRIGIVKKVFVDTTQGDLRYLTEIQDKSDKIQTNCRAMRRFGGVYNYEDIVNRGYNTNDTPDPVQNYECKAGDIVLVAFFNGEGREGVILGGLTHAARKVSLDIADGPQYKSEFNGVETLINKDGEYIVTFRGQPTNLAQLSNTPRNKIPAPTYDTAVGTSFYKFDKTGSFTVSDNSQGGVQSIFIDKPSGVIQVLSGSVSLKISKSPQSVEWACKTMDTKAQDKISATTKEFTVDSSTRAYIKTPKVAIGTDAIELLDQLAKLIDALGTVMPISPIGQCTSLKASPGWPGVETVKGKIKQITGGF